MYVNSDFEGRSPQGERGLKYGLLHPVPAARCRSPQGERGLKSGKDRVLARALMSLSARRAWIEIQALNLIQGKTPGRSPQGERGLKFDGYGHAASARDVALRKESVD